MCPRGAGREPRRYGAAPRGHGAGPPRGSAIDLADAVHHADGGEGGAVGDGHDLVARACQSLVVAVVDLTIGDQGKVGARRG